MLTLALNKQFSWYLLTALSVAMSLTFGMSTARGELLFSDSFDYPPGRLDGDGPPADAPPGQTGWSVLAGNPKVTSKGLHLIEVLSEAGGAAGLRVTGSDTCTAVASLTPINSGTVWIGFLIRVVHSGPRFGFAVLNVSDGIAGDPTPGYGVVFDTRQYGIDNDTGASALTGIPQSYMTSWLVVELNFNKGEQTLRVDPPSADSPPQATLAMTPQLQANGFSQIWLNEGLNDGSFAIDEVRVGTTFNDIRTGQ